MEAAALTTTGTHDDPRRETHELPPRMTWPEIKAAYPDQWVILGELDSDPVTLQFFSGVVYGHGHTSVEAEAEARPRLPRGQISARRFTGRIWLPPRW